MAEPIHKLGSKAAECKLLSQVIKIQITPATVEYFTEVRTVYGLPSNAKMDPD